MKKKQNLFFLIWFLLSIVLLRYLNSINVQLEFMVYMLPLLLLILITTNRLFIVRQKNITRLGRKSLVINI